MDMSELVRVILRHKLIALATLVAVVASGAFFLVRAHPVYQSTASVALLPDARHPELLGAYDTVVDRLLPLYAMKVRSATFLDQVATRLPGQVTGRQLRKQVTAKPDPAASVLMLQVRGGDPQATAEIARAVTAELRSELQAVQVISFDVIETPEVPDRPVAPRPKLILAALLVLGAFLGVAVAAIWDRMFGRIHTLEELKVAATDQRILGVVPYERMLARSPPEVFIGNPVMTRMEEAVRSIRTVLVGPGWATPTFETIAVTSLDPGDGKSTMTANLAVVIAEIGIGVLVVDADTRQPRQHELFGLPAEPGLSSVLVTPQDVTTIVQDSRYPKVSVVTAGPPLQRHGQTVELYVNVAPKLRSLADFVVIDSASLSGSADVRLLTAMIDGIILLIRSGSTSKDRLRRALEELANVGTPVLGLVLMMGARGRVRAR
jgi:capsular exopolysaccharide synthesis family protein